jgi:hypothetical protein
MSPSTLKSGCQLPGVPEQVRASRQMLPPAVTWPVYITQCGDTRRTKKGLCG